VKVSSSSEPSHLNHQRKWARETWYEDGYISRELHLMNVTNPASPLWVEDGSLLGTIVKSPRISIKQSVDLPLRSLLAKNAAQM
jgi:hypothetical protein